MDGSGRATLGLTYRARASHVVRIGKALGDGPHPAFTVRRRPRPSVSMADEALAPCGSATNALIPRARARARRRRKPYLSCAGHRETDLRPTVPSPLPQPEGPSLFQAEAPATASSGRRSPLPRLDCNHHQPPTRLSQVRRPAPLRARVAGAHKVVMTMLSHSQ